MPIVIARSLERIVSAGTADGANATALPTAMSTAATACTVSAGGRSSRSPRAMAKRNLGRLYGEDLEFEDVRALLASLS
jgi:hypothetical protein